jgi:hypothetical protein
MSECVVVLDRFGDYHATVSRGNHVANAQKMVKDLGLDDLPGEVFHYTVVETDDPRKARILARGAIVRGSFRMP